MFIQSPAGSNRAETGPVQGWLQVQDMYMYVSSAELMQIAAYINGVNKDQVLY